MAFIGRQRYAGVPRHLQRTPAYCVKNGEHDPVSIERCWQAVEHQLKSAGFVREIKPCQRVLTGSDSCLGSCGTHRRVSHQRQCRIEISVSAVTSDRAGLSKPASSEKLLIYRNLLNNQEVVLSFEQVSIFLAVPREMPEFICSVGGNPGDYTKTPKSHRKFRPCRSRLLLKDFVAIDGGMLQVIRLNYSLRKRCGFADPAATASLGEYPRCRV